jgi:membrane protein YdbS with pleckstrin-like domain
MQMATSPTREKFPLSNKKIIKKTITSTIGLLILVAFYLPFAIAMGFVGELRIFLGVITLLFFAFIGIVILLSYFYQKWYFAVYFYDLTEDYIIIRKGPITPREITIPYERVQDVYIDQDIFDRFFGLYDVHLSSATVSSGMAAHIDGVEKLAADGLRAMLLETVSKRISKTKTQAD